MISVYTHYLLACISLWIYLYVSKAIDHTLEVKATELLGAANHLITQSLL